VEKNNDDSKRHYFSSNHHEAPAEIIRSDARLEMLVSAGMMVTLAVREGSDLIQSMMMTTGMEEESRKSGETNVGVQIENPSHHLCS